MDDNERDEMLDGATNAILDVAEAYGEVVNWNVKAELSDGIEIEVWFANDDYHYYVCENGAVRLAEGIARGA